MNVHKDGPKIVFFNVLKNDNNLENILKKKQFTSNYSNSFEDEDDDNDGEKKEEGNVERMMMMIMITTTIAIFIFLLGK